MVPNSSVRSWSRAREAVLVLAAVVASFGVLIAGVAYAVQPVREDVQAVREDVRVLQATMGDVRERLVRSPAKIIFPSAWSRQRNIPITGEGSVISRRDICFRLRHHRSGMTTSDSELRGRAAALGKIICDTLLRVEKDIEALKEGQARILALLERRDRDSAS